jgi:hypothetical protein
MEGAYGRGKPSFGSTGSKNRNIPFKVMTPMS